MTDAQNSVATRIFNQCIRGTDINPGVPAALAQLMTGQSFNETNGWTSNFYVNYNNGFGISCDPSWKRATGCSSEDADNGVPVGVYDSVEDSAMDVIDWIYRRVNDGKFPSDLSTITTADQYANLLHNAGYFTSSASSYASRIKTFLQQAGNLFHKR